MARTESEYEVKSFKASLVGAIIVIVLTSVALVTGWGTEGEPRPDDPNRLWHHRNLGKAFYENPTTHFRAVDEFKKALDLNPESARERVNYGLALLRAGQTEAGIEELFKAQEQDPAIPHTWFNLGIEFKKTGQYERAVPQLEEMVKLVPDEAKAHYNLGVLYRLTGRTEETVRHFELAAELDPNLAGPRFQLYNAYRAQGRAEEARRQLEIFQEIKRQQAGAAIPEDLDWSFYSEVYDVPDPHWADEIPTSPLELRFEPRLLAEGLGAENPGMIVLDATGDGSTDLLTWAGGRLHLFRNGTERVQETGLEVYQDVVSAAAGDFNNDGLADLCLLTSSGALLLVNRGGAFEPFEAQIPTGRYSKAIWVDFDHDYDLDLLLLGERSVLMRNNGAAGFSDHTSAFPFVEGHALDGTHFDLVKDTDGMDLVVTYRDRSAVLYRDRLAGKYEAVPIPEVPSGATAVLAYDLDNDGWTDLVATTAGGLLLVFNREGRFEASTLVESSPSSVLAADLENNALTDLIVGTSVHRNQGLGRFSGGESLAPFEEVVASTRADFNRDGRVDLVFLARSGGLHLLENQTETENGWLGVSVEGVRNVKLAHGAEIEVKAGWTYQKKRYFGVPLLFGLRSYPEADTIRITWPNGLIQNEMNQPSGEYVHHEEKQRLSGSCPMVFTWNGSEFEFIADILGVAPLGASAGEGKYFPVDHDEYIQIPAGALAPRDGYYDVRITEELREVGYIDRVELIAIDHPEEVEIFTNDKFKAPPFPEFRLFGVTERRYPASARDHRGRDVLERILARDRRYADGFRRDLSGVAEIHHLELDFGPAAAPENQAILVLHGWVDWVDGSTILRAAQEGRGGIFLPYLQVRNKEGEWETVIDDMGVPAGKPKTIVVDLTGRFLSEARQVRIVTNLSVYWDEIFLSEETREPQVSLHRLDPDVADLRYRGFSEPIVHPQRLQPESFDYSRWSPISMWNPPEGLYTRFGDVRELVTEIDDRFAIIGPGDELQLLFRADRLPPLEPGFKRSFLFFVDGWAKDGDLNTAYAKSVEPLPFHGMSGYPYPVEESYPDTEFHRRYREEYNTRPALRLIRPLNEDLLVRQGP